MENTIMYRYDTRYNVFPEEVFVHEFLHTLERNLNEYDVKFPELHSNEEYGYKDSGTSSIKIWYRDYMRKNIKTSSGYTGLTDVAYTTMPYHSRDFEDSEEIEFKVEPENFILGIAEIATNLFNNRNNLDFNFKQTPSVSVH